MLRGKGGDAGVQELFRRHGDGIANGKNARVKHTDHVAGIGLFHDFTLCGHQLLGLGKAHLSAALHMIVFCISLEFAGANTHKGQAVTVGLVHIGLDLKDKSGEIRIESIHLPWSDTRDRGGGVSFRKFSRKGSMPKLVSAEPKNTGES